MDPDSPRPLPGCNRSCPHHSPGGTGGRELTLAMLLPPRPLTSLQEGLTGILWFGSFAQVQGRPGGGGDPSMEEMELSAQEVLCGLTLLLCAVGEEPETRRHPYLLPSSQPTGAINLSGWSASHTVCPPQSMCASHSHKVPTDPSPPLSASHCHPGRWVAPLLPHSLGVRGMHSAETQGPRLRPGPAKTKDPHHCY